MLSTQTFYTMPEAEVIYYTPGQLGFQYRRLNPQRLITNNNTSYLSLLHWNFPQVINTHSTLSEKSDQQRGNIV